MDPNETMVEENFDDVPADDALGEDIAEETDESESLESLNVEEEEQPAEDEPKKGAQGTSEPGYIKKRIEKAVSRAIAETEARMNAMFEEKMAPIRDRMLTDEAQELVRQGEFRTLERAKEYLQLKQGITPVNTGEAPAQPRSANGQFAPKEDPATTARISMLTHQADRIRESGGPDVIGEFRNNPEIKKKIINGEMDFYDVAEQMKAPKRKPPSPMRSPNGASGQNTNAIDSMSDDQFRRLEKRIQNGERFRLS